MKESYICTVSNLYTMVNAVTEGIKVSVETFFQPRHSSPAQGHFVFAYKVFIHNESSSAVQLLRRHWHIFDACGVHREVEGEGVVGEQPIIEPGKSYEYVSGCDLRTEIGKMLGTYQMKRLLDEEDFVVTIPEFMMVYPFKLN